MKSSPVRRTLEQRLIDDLRFSLASEGETTSRVERDAARLVVHGIREVGTSALTCSRVFGVAYAAPAILVPANMEGVTSTLVNLARQSLEEGGSFAIQAHRSTPGTLPRRSVELSGGAEVLRTLKDRKVRVDLNHPDVTLYVDLIGDWAYVYREKLEGPGGLPLSSQWKMLAVLDSGPLTILAAYSMMRRGCMVQLLIPTSNTIKPFDEETQLLLANKLGKLVARPGYKAFRLDLDQLVKNGKVSRRDPRKLVRAAAIEFAKKKRFRGIVLGDIGGRLEASMPYRYSAVEIPIVQPLLGLLPEDIDQLSRLVGIKVGAVTEQGSSVEEPVQEGLPPISELEALVQEVSF